MWMCNMYSTHADRSILQGEIDLSGCVVCVAHMQIDLYYMRR